MEASNQPAKFPIPFGNNAGAGFIRPIPEASQISITPGAASLADGFPPLTFLAKAAGGVPPFGQDENGILYQITALIQWLQAGGLPAYDSAYSTAIGGYPSGSVLVKADGSGFWISTADNNATDPDTGGAGWVSLFLTRLTAALTLFVSTTGSDSNNGLTSATAFATIQHAWNVLVGSYDLNGFNAVIQVGDGTYNQSTTLYGSINGLGPTTGGSTHNTVTIQGNVTTPTNCVINGTSVGDIFVVGNGAFVTIDGFKLQTTFPGNSILANAGAIVVTGNLNFGPITTSASCHMTASNSSCIFIGKSYTISGSAASHIDVNSGASFQKNSSAATVVTLTGTPNFPVGFIDTASCSSLNLGSANHTFSGAATGLRYTINTNSVVNTAGSGANYFPGSVAGTISTGGIYL